MEGKQFVNLLDAPYSRRGSYIAFANDNYGEDLYGKCSLWLCNCRTIGFAMARPGRGLRIPADKIRGAVPGYTCAVHLKNHGGRGNH